LANPVALGGIIPADDAIFLVPGLPIRAATFWPIVQRAECPAAPL